jgi:hypothetical protein
MKPLRLYKYLIKNHINHIITNPMKNIHIKSGRLNDEEWIKFITENRDTPNPNF